MRPSQYAFESTWVGCVAEHRGWTACAEGGEVPVSRAAPRGEEEATGCDGSRRCEEHQTEELWLKHQAPRFAHLALDTPTSAPRGRVWTTGGSEPTELSIVRALGAPRLERGGVLRSGVLPPTLEMRKPRIFANS